MSANLNPNSSHGAHGEAQRHGEIKSEKSKIRFVLFPLHFSFFIFHFSGALLMAIRILRMRAFAPLLVLLPLLSSGRTAPAKAGARLRGYPLDGVLNSAPRAALLLAGSFS